MILATFTRDEVIQEMEQASNLLAERAQGFLSYNRKAIASKIRKDGVFKRVFHCVYKGQEYYQRHEFIIDGDYFNGNRGSVITTFQDDKGRFVLIHNPIKNLPDDEYLRGSLELKIFSGHFVERFFERTGMSGEGKSLIEKAFIVLDNLQTICAATTDDEVYRRHGEPTLTYRFLQEGPKDYECTYINDSDIAIVECYGNVPVWRTYISEEMLHKSQSDYINRPDIQEGVQIAKELSEKYKSEES